LQHIDLGGGLGIAYEGGPDPDPARYAATVMPIVAATGLELLLEPGRFLVARAGILVGEVADIKAFAGSPRFIVLDTGMTEMIRPALYGAFHRISAVTPRPGPEHVYEVVGPLCETSDTLGHDRTFGPVDVGDALAVHDAGAYGMVMASNYNRRPFGAEVLVEDGGWRIIRRRQTYKDLMQYEK
jgi:diaminopimelate decarboxylase